MINSLSSVNFNSVTKKSDKSIVSPSFKGTVRLQELPVDEFIRIFSSGPSDFEHNQSANRIIKYLKEELGPLFQNPKVPEDEVLDISMIEPALFSHRFSLKYIPGKKGKEMGITLTPLNIITYGNEISDEVICNNVKEIIEKQIINKF